MSNEPEKRCSKCGEMRPISQFVADRKKKDGRHSHCQPCRRAVAREKYATNPAAGLSRGAWLAHKNGARRRGIEFHFTCEEWLAWWTGELAKRGQDATRGKGASLLVMCRFEDQGAYEPGNVYCGTNAENLAATAPAKRHHDNYWIRGRAGADHPKSKAVAGFVSVTAAAQHYGVSRAEIRRRLADGRIPGENPYYRT